MPLHVSSTMCSSSGGQNCIIQHLVSSHSVGGRPVYPVHRTATYRCNDTRCCIIQFWPPDDDHMVLETCKGMKWTYCKTNFCASGWLITTIKSDASLEHQFLLLPHLCSRLCEKIVLRHQTVSLCVPPVYAQKFYVNILYTSKFLSSCNITEHYMHSLLQWSVSRWSREVPCQSRKAPSPTQSPIK